MGIVDGTIPSAPLEKFLFAHMSNNHGFWGYHYRANGQQKYARWTSAFRGLSRDLIDVRNRLWTTTMEHLGNFLSSIHAGNCDVFQIRSTNFHLLCFSSQIIINFRGYVDHKPAQWIVLWGMLQYYLVPGPPPPHIRQRPKLWSSSQVRSTHYAWGQSSVANVSPRWCCIAKPHK